MKKQSLLFIFSIIWMTSICGCQISSTKNKSEFSFFKTKDFSCLPGDITFAFPIGETSRKTTINKPFLPDKPWRKVTTYDNKASPFSVLVQRKQGNDLFWANFGSEDGVVVYSIRTKEWEQYVKPSVDLQHLVIFVDRLNAIWAYKDFITSNPNLLYQYDEAERKFEPIIDEDGLLVDQRASHEVLDLQVDSEGNFWMIVNDSSRNNIQLIKFNPFSKKAEPQLEDLEISNTLALSPMNKLFVYLSDKHAVIEYDTSTKQYKELIIPTEKNSGEPVSLYYDNQHRLWVDNFGFFDWSENEFNPKWYQIVRPSVFLTYVETQGVWLWSIPIYTYESSNGLLWYYSYSDFGVGTGWVDPQKGVWCIFTSYNTQVQVDSSGNLWIFIEDSLYRLDNSYGE